MSKPLTVGSLFSGIGGIDLGLERAGMKVAWQCEKDDAARRVLARRWPDVHCYDDVTTLKGPDVPRVDVLCGGFPCQDLSVAGRRAGLAGERSGLFHEFMRLADELAPRWVLVENVPGLLSSNDGADMGIVLDTLADLGYGWCYRVLDAQYFGVAQRRRRVFIVGCAGDQRRAAQVLLEQSCCDGDPPPRREAGKVVAALTADGVGTCGADDNRGQAGHLIPALAATLTGGSATGSGVNPPGRRREDDYNLVSALSTPTLSNALCSNRGQRNDPNEQTLIPAIAFNARQDPDSWVERIGPIDTDGCSAAVAYRKAQKAHDPDDCERWEEADTLDTLAAHGTTTAAAISDGMAVRRLMPIECERLQGFPDGWTAGETDSARYRLLGNAVCVPVAAWIGRRILEAVAS